MDTNIGTLDQSLRILGLVLSFVYYFFNQSGGFISTAAGIFGIYCFMTALTRYSPVWELLGISTVKKKTTEGV